MRFCITTQYCENYGTYKEPYWKFKGSEDYIIDVPGFNYNHEMAFKKGQMIVDELLPKIEYKNDCTEECMIGWSFVPDDYLTEFERQQLELDGKIVYPAKRLTYDELMENA